MKLSKQIGPDIEQIPGGVGPGLREQWRQEKEVIGMAALAIGTFAVAAASMHVDTFFINLAAEPIIQVARSVSETIHISPSPSY
ncbi:MAG: hypothetical protein JWS12_933 [Candidatus Saccharibacteria bacterium]|nr:hypothetical protein [Candidatus Saccharibacteria bacterium]